MNKKSQAHIVDEEESTATRREFLRAMAAAGAATLMAGEPRAASAPTNRRGSCSIRGAKADACILLWMAGGMAAPETFDPKRYQPFEVGLPVEKVMSTFPAIDTVVDNIKISQGLEHVAQVMDRGTLIRSHVLPDLGHILHSRHQYHWHTGYVPPQTVAAPHIGAWMARVLGPINPVMPPFINIGQRLEGHGEVGGTEGVHDRRLLRLASSARSICRSRKTRRWRCGRRRGWTPGGSRTATGSIKKLVAASPQARYASDYQQESMLRAIDAAHRLLSSKDKQAFDLSLEKKASLRDVRHGPLRPRLLARAAAGRSRGAVRRSDDRVRSVRALGHARERPRHGRADEARNRSADRAAHSRSGRARPAGPHARRAGQRVQPRHDDRRRAGQHGPRPVAGQDRRAARSRSTTACTATSPARRRC